MPDFQFQMKEIGRLQRHLVPGQLPRLPDWEFASYYSVGPLPGGDYFDLQVLPDGQLSIFLADASGHGGLSAVVMVMVHTLIHACPHTSGADRRPFCSIPTSVIQPPDVALTHLNRILVENTLDDQFMTAFAAHIDTTIGRCVFSNAGHPPPRRWIASENRVDSDTSGGGLPLGIESYYPYSRAQMIVEPGDVLLFYTDGLTEAQNEQGEQFGVERLDRALRKNANDDVENIKSTVLQNLDQFLGGLDPVDDVTLLVARRSPTPNQGERRKCIPIH